MFGEGSAMAESLDRLKRRLKEARDLQHVLAVLGWDQQTHMPPGGAQARAAQISTLAGIQHEIFVSDETKELIEGAEAETGELPYDSDDAALLRVARRDWENGHKLPPSSVAEVSSHASISQQAWASARENDDFGSFSDFLQKSVGYSRQAAEYLGYEENPYDALLDQFEPGMKASQVKEIFDSLKSDLVPLVMAIGERAGSVSDEPVRRRFDERKQEGFGVTVAQAIGYDFSRGRQDRAVHPFAISFSRDDVRITTRFEPEFLNPALFGTMHEAGHALYEQGVAENLDETPLGSGTSLGVHESQSRLWENVVGRSRGFWQHFYPQLQETFPESLSDVDLEAFYRAINKVEPSLIRVEADEVTYTLHIMLRFEMEMGLLDGSIPVRDAPGMWNQKYQQYLGVTPPNDRLGILQDVHWSQGIFGYFPTYALGTILSLQLFDKAVEAHPGIPDDISNGRFDVLRSWLTENVYRHGRKYEPLELVERATGKPLQTTAYVSYLRQKFGEIYGLHPL
jgi:carboxypeptidase Taq